MVEDIKISQEIIELNMIQEFIDKLYFGEQIHKSRIAFISNRLNDIIKELKTIQECKQSIEA